MAVAGLRVRGGEGAHRIVFEYARYQLADVVANEDVREAEDIRKDRALAEYGDFATRQLDAEHVRWAADVAERIVNAIASIIATKAQRPRGKRA
jgi:DNA replicative helicase MCM subunit Mcm2 (Cdc46/Mcm family)